MGEFIWIGWIIALVGIGLGFLRNWRLSKQLKKSQALVERLTADLATARAEVAGIPQAVFALVEAVLKPPSDEQGGDGEASARLPALVWWQDVTGRGGRELLVQHGEGATDLILRVLGNSGPAGQFGVIGEMVSDRSGFAIGDFDGDGQVEVRATPSDRREEFAGQGGHTHFGGPVSPMVETIWRWNGREFEMSHGRRWDPMSEDRPDWIAQFEDQAAQTRASRNLASPADDG
jgi:hypothetical protein